MIDFDARGQELTDKWLKTFRDLKDETLGFFEDLENSNLPDSHKIGLVIKMTESLNKMRMVIASD